MGASERRDHRPFTPFENLFTLKETDISVCRTTKNKQYPRESANLNGHTQGFQTDNLGTSFTT